MRAPDYHALMLEAVKLSRAGFGLTAPNPCVGALLVRNGNIVAQGWHRACGGAHAEREALADARAKGVNPAECTLVVTLEPCNHYGKTPPCTDALLEAGIKHVVIGAADSNPAASGGAQRLREAGVRVDMDVARQECLDNIADFLLFQREHRAYLILKLASTLDGRIATRSGHSQWVSGQQALERTHWLRARVQAVMVGGNTFYEDDPLLTPRFGANSAEPSAALAVIITSRLPVHNSPLRLLRERAGSTIFFCDKAAAASKRAFALRRMGVTVYGLTEAPASMGAGALAGLNLREALEILRQEHGCWHVMCEGGGRLGLSLAQNGLVDEFHLRLAPKILGDNQAGPIFDGLSPLRMDEALRLRLAAYEQCGEDLCVTLFPK